MMFLDESEVETPKPVTTNILIHIKNNMLKSLWNSKFADLFHKPIDDEVCRVLQCSILSLKDL